MDTLMHPEARLLVCDGRKALVLRNTGPAGKPALVVEREFHGALAAHTADLGTDKPGRLTQAAGQRSAIEGTDWHAAEEEAFVRHAVAEFGALCEAAQVGEIVLVAPPRALATIRKVAPKRMLDKVIGEIDKDLTKHPVDEITRIVNA
jgi:protein required for attachment to host cells